MFLNYRSPIHAPEHLSGSGTNQKYEACSSNVCLTLLFRVRELDGRKIRIGMHLGLAWCERLETEGAPRFVYKGVTYSMHRCVHKFNFASRVGVPVLFWNEVLGSQLQFENLP